MKVYVKFWSMILLLALVVVGCGSSGGGGTVAAGDTTAPSVPTNPAATAGSASQINLSWTASTDDVGVTGYKIYKAGVYLKTVATTATSDTGLTASTNYCYTVSAIDAANNESAQSAQACATTSAVSSAGGLVPDTGQTTKYSIAFGDDSDYLINPPSYTDNGNGTITDNVTGLVWQKQDDGTLRTWDEAIAYCSGNTAGLPGSGWRLPTDFELMTIVDYGTYNPSINTTYFPNTVAASYWSSTTGANGTTSAWDVSFYYGTVYDGSKPANFYVRCVR